MTSRSATKPPAASTAAAWYAALPAAATRRTGCAPRSRGQLARAAPPALHRPRWRSSHPAAPAALGSMSANGTSGWKLPTVAAGARVAARTLAGSAPLVWTIACPAPARRPRRDRRDGVIGDGQQHQVDGRGQLPGIGDRHAPLGTSARKRVTTPGIAARDRDDRPAGAIASRPPSAVPTRPGAHDADPAAVARAVERRRADRAVRWLRPSGAASHEPGARRRAWQIPRSAGCIIGRIKRCSTRGGHTRQVPTQPRLRGEDSWRPDRCDSSPTPTRSPRAPRCVWVTAT